MPSINQKRRKKENSEKTLTNSESLSRTAKKNIQALENQ